MADFDELMKILSMPRPNGSPALERTRQSLVDWFKQRSIPIQLHAFRLYPYWGIAIGIWLILSRSLLALAIILRWGWPALVIALLGLLGGLVDTITGIPLVSWIGAQTGYNLLAAFGPQEARQEIVLTAHYDSKTEMLDHQQRMFFLKSLPLGILLTIVLGVLGPLDRLLWQADSPWAVLTFWLGVLLSLVLAFLAWGLGLNLSLGRLREPSQGAVDNGAACAVLLGLAERLEQGEIQLSQTRLTLALFCGEEVNMQGSMAYVRSRNWPLPTLALNLEIMAQDGEYVIWEQDGYSLKLWPCSERVNQAISEAVCQVTGNSPRLAGPMNSDGGSFLRRGIPASTLGTYDKTLRDRGFHLPSDNLGRVDMKRLPEEVEILAYFVKWLDRQGF
jgi:hypothetical protein